MSTSRVLDFDFMHLGPRFCMILAGNKICCISLDLQQGIDPEVEMIFLLGEFQGRYQLVLGYWTFSSWQKLFMPMIREVVVGVRGG